VPLAGSSLRPSTALTDGFDDAMRPVAAAAHPLAAMQNDYI